MPRACDKYCKLKKSFVMKSIAQNIQIEHYKHLNLTSHKKYNFNLRNIQYLIFDTDEHVQSRLVHGQVTNKW